MTDTQPVSDLTVVGQPEEALEDITPEELEFLEAATGHSATRLYEQIERSQKTDEPLPMWCISVILFMMAHRQFPELTWTEFRQTPLVDLSGRVLSAA